MSSVWGSFWESFASPTAVVAQALPLLADAAAKGAIVFAVAAAAAWVLRRRSAATRHAIWAGAVAAQLAIPVLGTLLPSWRVPLFPAMNRRLSGHEVWVVAPRSSSTYTRVDISRPYVPPTTRASTAPIAARAVARAGVRAGARSGAWGGVGFAGPRGGVYAREPELVTSEAGVRWVRMLSIVWLVGSLAILGRFLAGTVAVWRLARRSERVDDGRWLSLAQRIAVALRVGRPLTLLRSERFGIPVTWGVVYPVVLLPDDADGWSEERRQYVMVHEMAHVKRIDALTQLVAQIALAIFWFDPLMWLAVHRMRVEREHACDDYVLRQGTPASTYASDLLEMVRALGGNRREAAPAFASLAMARPAELEARMLAILDAHHDRRPLGSAPALAFSALALVCLMPLAALNPFGRGQRPRAARDAWLAPAAVAVEIPVLDEDAVRAVAAPEIAALWESTKETRAALARDVSVATAAISAARAATVTTTKRASVSSCGSMSVEGTRISTARSGGSGTSVYLEDDDSNKAHLQFISSTPRRCLHVAVRGAVTFSPDETEIRGLSRGGRFYVHEKSREVDRELTITRGAGSELEYEYVRDDEPTAFDAEARGWFAALIPEILRESGLNAKERMARIRRDGGIPAALAEIGRTASTSAKRVAYEALLDGGDLTDEDVERLVQQAGRDLSSSDGELRAVLARVPRAGHLTPRAGAAAVAVAGRITSDGEKRAVLQQYALGGDHDLLVAAMRQARQITSDGEKSALLRTVVERYLGTDDETLRAAYFGAAETIVSDGEHRSALAAALPYARVSPQVVLGVIEGARHITSDGEKAELLVAVLRQRALTTPAQREALMRATRTISSDSEYRRVMEVALQQ